MSKQMFYFNTTLGLPSLTGGKEKIPPHTHLSNPLSITKENKLKSSKSNFPLVLPRKKMFLLAELWKERESAI